MKIRSVSRYFSEALKSIFRNKMMSLSSIIIASACLLIMILMYCVTVNIHSMLADIESDVRVSVFVDDAISADDLSALYSLIQNNEHVTGVEYLSKDDNLSSMIVSMKLDPALFDLFAGSNPLRRRLDVSINGIENVRVVADWLQSYEMEQMGVANVNHAADTVESLNAINNAIRSACIGIISVLGLLSVVIITNTIRLTIDSRKNEISIMKYIGSTNWFIRWPFILEGMILGLAGSLISTVLVVMFYDRLLGLIVETFLFGAGRISLLPGIKLFPVMIPAALVIGGMIGTLSSLGTIRKYLRV